MLHIQGKGRDSKAEFVKLSKETFGAIQEYLTAIDSNSITDDVRGTPLFLTKPVKGVRKRLSTKMIRTQNKDLLISIGYNSRAYSVHSLRHTFATTALLRGAHSPNTRLDTKHRDNADIFAYGRAKLQYESTRVRHYSNKERTRKQ